jgi:ribosome-binding protein aMBF1 (putative translation factor)
VLVFARKALGLSQEGLANKLELKQEDIAHYEANALVDPHEYRIALADLIRSQPHVIELLRA